MRQPGEPAPGLDAEALTADSSAHSLAEQNPAPVLELDREGAILYLNPAARRAFPDVEALRRSPLLDGVADAVASGPGGAADATALEWRGRVFQRAVALAPHGRTIRVFLQDQTPAHRALGRREAILAAVSHAATEVLRARDPQAALGRILDRLGRATEISRVYAFQNSGSGAGLRIHPRAEWVAPGIEAQEDNEALDGALYSEAGFDRWRGILERGGIVLGHVHDFPAAERPLLESQGIHSLLVVPVFAGDDWWGFLGFDACDGPREWRPAEIDALRAVSDTLGLALQRRIIEASLRESEARFRVIFERGNDAIFVHPAGAEGGSRRFREVNEVACRLLGYDRKQLLALSMDAILHGPTGEGRPPGRTLPPGEGFMMERVLATADGEPVPVEINARVLELDGERLVVSIARDIRERRQAEAALARSQAQLQQAQKMDAIGRLAGGVAHDFNNLLTGIKGTAEILMDEAGTGSPLYADLREILATADRAASLTGQLLSFSRRHLIEPVDVDLGAVLRDTERMLQRLIGEPIDLSVHLDPGLEGVRMGSGQIEQVLVNLAINARDAMPDGGSLRIGAESRTLGPDDEAGLDPGRYVVITVRDTGTGMSEETLEHVFEPFFTTKQPGRGTGLGLSTVYGIVQQANGAIDVRSEPGRGTTFRILLPAVTLERQAPDAAASREGGAGRGERILLVEDEASVSLLVERILQRAGYEVVTAHTGEEAVACEGPPVDLLITDVVLPGQSGQEVVGTLRERWPGLAVIYMSGYSEEEVNRHGVREPEHFVQKPFSPRDLLATIRAVLDGGAAGGTNGRQSPAT